MANAVGHQQYLSSQGFIDDDDASLAFNNQRFAPDQGTQLIIRVGQRIPERIQNYIITLVFDYRIAGVQ